MIAKYAIQVRGRHFHFVGVVLGVSITSLAPLHIGTGLMQSQPSMIKETAQIDFVVTPVD